MTAIDSSTPPTATEALAAPLSRLAGCWLELRCACGRVSAAPLKLMGIRHGGERALAELVRAFVCRTCGRRPAAVWLCETPNREFCHGPAPGWSVRLDNFTICEGMKV